MKELKILVIVLILVGVTYWGIEPYAHSKLHHEVAPALYDFAKEDINLAKSDIEDAKAGIKKAQKIGDKKTIEAAHANLKSKQEMLDKYTKFWHSIEEIDLSKGDAKRGEAVFDNAGCSGCHGIKSANKPAPLDALASSQSYGVNPPDLSDAGAIYDPKFLAALITNPVMAMKLSHKFNETGPAFPMPDFAGAGGADPKQELADLIAYLQSVAPKNLSDKEVFVSACIRCHDIKYAKLYTDGDRLALKKYLGSNPPDLSIMIRSKGAKYLHEFINDTQKMLPHTVMPRVGLTQAAETKVVNYIESVGDSKKSEREKTTIYIMIYFVILSIFATLWKRKIWSKLH